MDQRQVRGCTSNAASRPSDGRLVAFGCTDNSVRAIDAATGRQVLSITPGALRGGLMAVDRHPVLEHVVAAGADGTPRAYGIHRHAKRVIGDAANLVFPLPAVSGRVFGLRFFPDGKRVAGGDGTVRFYDGDGKATRQFPVARPASAGASMRLLGRKTVWRSRLPGYTCGSLWG